MLCACKDIWFEEALPIVENMQCALILNKEGLLAKSCHVWSYVGFSLRDAVVPGPPLSDTRGAKPSSAKSALMLSTWPVRSHALCVLLRLSLPEAH